MDISWYNLDGIKMEIFSQNEMFYDYHIWPSYQNDVVTASMLSPNN